jgi:hypothetical protein
LRPSIRYLLIRKRVDGDFEIGQGDQVHVGVVDATRAPVASKTTDADGFCFRVAPAALHREPPWAHPGG